MHEVLGQYGIAGAILLIVFLLGKSAIKHIGIPLMQAHVSALKTWQTGTERIGDESAAMAQALASMQATQVEIHLAVASFTEQQRLRGQGRQQALGQHFLRRGVKAGAPDV